MSTRVILIAIAAFAASTSAAAQPIVVEADVPTATISYADLNVQSSAGRASLERRVRQAAESLCVDRNVRDVHRTALGLTCVSHAIASANPQIQQIAANGTARDLATATIVISAK
jgi:UrcA family protein